MPTARRLDCRLTAKRRYNQTLDLSPGVRHAATLWRTVGRLEDCPASFSVAVMAPDADHDFTEAQMIGRALGYVVVCGCLMAGASLQAHHSLAGVYDMKAEKEIVGTLTMIKFVNPHGSMTITVKNPDGTTTDWTFTTGSATTLADRGISKLGPNALKVGEPLTAKFIPARNGSPLGFLKSITRADGTVLNISNGNPND
jgi:hypothetical protein